jgi:hypothetical protein
MSPRRRSKPRRTGRLVVGRNVTLTLSGRESWEAVAVESLQSAVRVRVWLEMAARLQGLEPQRRGPSGVGSGMTENTGLCVAVLFGDRRQPARTEAEEPLQGSAQWRPSRLSAVVYCNGCELARALQLIVVMSCINVYVPNKFNYKSKTRL